MNFREGLLWKVTAVEGKGEGVVAKTNIPPGTLVLEDHPLFIVPKTAHSENSNTLSLVLDEAVSNLDKHKLDTFKSLADFKSEVKTNKGIYFTNCFSIGNGNTAMLPVISRLNHSCSPNTEFYWNDEKNVEELRATRAILEGEELTDCYLDFTVKGSLTRSERRIKLNIGYGFLCTCSLCSLDDDLSETDDSLRTEACHLSDVCREMNESSDTDEFSKLVIKAERWLHICAQLKYKVTHQIEAADYLFTITMMVGDVNRAKDVAEQGLKMSIIRFGEKNKIPEDWRRRLDNPVLYMID